MKKENTVLEDEFKEYCTECEAALRTTMAKVINVREFAKASTKRNPFGSVTDRIKSFESVVEKCKRKGYDLTIESIKRNVLDVAGIRIVTLFPDDVYTVVEILHRIPGFNIDEEKDYIKNPKPNGYSSYHMNIRVEIYSPATGGSKLIPIEIQIRDKGMDYWASLEHVVKYKKDDPSPEVDGLFKEVAEIIANLGQKAKELRDFSGDTDS